MQLLSLAVSGELPATQKPSRKRVKCPYDYEITEDGRMVIDGEDFGDAEKFFEDGMKLRAIVRIWHEVSTSQEA